MVVGQYGLGVFNIKGVSFTVKRDERFVILGYSGTTALLTSILGTDRPVAGEIVIDGKLRLSYNELKYYKLHGLVGYQPQKSSIDENLNVRQHLTLFARLAGIEKANLSDSVTDMINDCQLEGYENTKAGDLSFGLKRRMSLAMALIGHPKLVLLDNPVDGNDPCNKMKLIKTILKYTEGRALIVATRDVLTAELLGHKIAVMHKGQFLAMGSVA